MPFLRSTLFNLSFYILTFFISILYLVVYIFTKQHAHYVKQFWGWATFKCLKIFLNITFNIKGLDSLSNEQPVIIASKHQSAWETALFNLVLTDPQFVLKKELLFIPLFGQCLWLSKSIAIDRSQGTKSLKHLFKQLQFCKTSKRPIIIFPEGTRNLPLEKGTYNSGVYLIYKELERPVVPVALNSGCAWPKKGWLKKENTIISVEFLPAIEPGLARKDFMVRLENSIEERSLELAQCLKK